MATFSCALQHVKEHLERCLPNDYICQTCRDVGHAWRAGGKLGGPATSVYLLLTQLLARVALRTLRHAAGVCVTFQAISKARIKLPLELLQKLVQQTLPADYASGTRYKQFDVHIVDGMSFLVEDTKDLARRLGKSTNQRGVSHGYPTPKLLTLVQAGCGFIGKAIILPYARQEFTCLSRLFKSVGAMALLLGDRALVSFAHLALLRAQGPDRHGCFRLPSGKVVHGRGKNSRRLIKRLGRQDLLVRWSATGRPATWMSKQRWDALRHDEPLVLRQIGFRICRAGFRTRWAWIITTLLDPVAYPAQELIDLYTQRWQIEVYFRDLKCTLRMRKVSARSIKGVQKEVLGFILLYNLIRTIMCEAAARQDVSPDRISFTDAMAWLLYAPPGTPLPKLIVNPVRKRATQPRRVKKGRHRFPQLNQSRAASCKPRCEVKI